MRFVIAVPGHIPLKSIRFSLVDVPDLSTLAQIWPETHDIWMGAGPVPALLHWLLTGLAWLVRIRVLPGLSWLASTIYFVTNHVRWGEHRGGMFVEVQGHGLDGSTVVREWHLLAEGDDGPLIPSMAVAALIRKSLIGQRPPPGARTAIADVGLSDYEALFARRTIFTATRQRQPIGAQSLFRSILGEAWDGLPPAIRQLHSTISISTYLGRCTVAQAGNPIARAVSALVGFPKGGTDQPIEVKLFVGKSGERWVRTVSGRTFSSTQTLPKGRSQGLLRERFGPVAVDMALVVEAQRLKYVIRRWSLLGIPMPLWLGPRTAATEGVDAQGRFRFDIELWHPFIGPLVHYAGWLRAAG